MIDKNIPWGDAGIDKIKVMAAGGFCYMDMAKALNRRSSSVEKIIKILGIPYKDKRKGKRS